MTDGFAKIRNGLKRHIEGRDGKQQQICLTDLGTYTFLHLYCDYDTGIYYGNAHSIASTTSDSPRTVQASLYRLRERQFINYRDGVENRGKRGSYPILIHKFEPTVGAHSGKRLDAWKHGELVKPEYESTGSECADDASLMRGGSADGTPKMRSGCASPRLKDEKTAKQTDEQTMQNMAAAAPSSALSLSSSSPKQEPCCPNCEEPVSKCRGYLSCKTKPESEPFRPVSEADTLAADLFSWLGAPAKYQPALPEWGRRIAADGNVSWLRTLLNYAVNVNDRFPNGIKAAVRRGDDLMDYLLVEKKENIISAFDVDEDKKKRPAKRAASGSAAAEDAPQYTKEKIGWE